ncbi:MAG: hypothetical protein ACR2RE_07070 [Geminicoccaceae bacterium]
MALNIEPRNYTLGRGRVYFGRFADGETVASEFRYVGNTPEFNLTIESEELDHFSSDAGVREKDDSVALEVNRTGTMTCDDIQAENLALFFFGTTEVLATAAAVGQSENFDDVTPGASYQIGVTATNPVGIMGLDNVVVTSNPIGTTYAAGTDYTIDEENGLLTILTSGNIPANGDIIVNYDVRSSTRTRILSGSTAVQGALMFVQENPTGLDRKYTLTQVKITPNGDLALKGDEWQQIPFSFEALKPGDGREAIYLDGTPAFA